MPFIPTKGKRRFSYTRSLFCFLSQVLHRRSPAKLFFPIRPEKHFLRIHHASLLIPNDFRIFRFKNNSVHRRILLQTPAGTPPLPRPRICNRFKTFPFCRSPFSAARSLSLFPALLYRKYGGMSIPFSLFSHCEISRKSIDKISFSCYIIFGGVRAFSRKRTKTVENPSETRFFRVFSWFTIRRDGSGGGRETACFSIKKSKTI